MTQTQPSSQLPTWAIQGSDTNDVVGHGNFWLQDLELAVWNEEETHPREADPCLP